MKDVAKLAGVSLSTVSRVVSGETNVEDGKVERVLEASRLLGYRRDHTASTLRRSDRHSMSIGLIWDDVSNPFFSLIHRGVEEIARERGVLALVGSSDRDAAQEQILAESFSSRGVDGLVIAPCGDDQGYLARERDAGMALVFVDRPPAQFAADCVVSDNRGGIDRAVEHLAAHGHRRIAYLGGRRNLFPALERRAGYEAAVQRLGIEFDERLIRIGLDAASGPTELDRMLRSDAAPTAVITAQNQISIGVLDYLHRRGLQQTIAMVAYDDLPMASILDPAVSVVAPDPVDIGRAAARLLFDRMDGAVSGHQTVTIPVPLIQRGSGEIRNEKNMADRLTTIPSYRQLPITPGLPTGSSWGVFGEDDERGAVNFITPDRVRQAARLVKSGETFGLSWDVELPDPAILGRTSFRHATIADAVGREDFYDSYYPQSSSQWDSLAHVRHPEFGFYNGRPEAAVAGSEGALGIQNWARDGIVGRFVLADVARYRESRGISLDCSTREVISATELADTLSWQGTELTAGDVLLIRFGWIRHYESLTTDERTRLTDTQQFPAPGIEAAESTYQWLWDNRIAAVAGDNPSLEAMPFDQTSVSGFAHFQLIALLGFAVGEMFRLDELAAACAVDRRYDGLLAAAPMNKRGGVGSPANAIAVR
jgi:LacI family transcriptional regulator